MSRTALRKFKGVFRFKCADMKTGFILHLDSLSVLDELTNEQAGILFKAIRDYNLGKETKLDFAMRMAFIPFKNQFERDLEKYNNTCERNKNNGSKGGRPKKPKETEKTQVVFEKPKKPDNKNDNDNKNEILFNDFWKLYDKSVDKQKSLQKFLKLKDEEIKLIFEVLPHYIANTPDKQFRKNPSTWINNKCWNDAEYNKPKVISYTPLIVHE